MLIVCADIGADAQRYLDYYVHEKGDRVAAGNLVRSLFPEVRDAQGNMRRMPPENVELFVMKMNDGHPPTPSSAPLRTR